MVAFQQGDYDAFGRLVEQYTDPLVNFFYYQCRDWDLAEDCCQEVWAKLFRSREEYQPRARFSTFLFRVARNHWIDCFRSRARRPTETSLDGDPDERSLGDSLESAPLPPDALMERKDVAGAVAAALAHLPPEMRDVFVLGEVEGLPYSEVAVILAIPVGTVKSRMFNAVRRLQELLGPARRERS
jgi:RNA polymerase sigma-70 factor (ECF subfamily)